MELEKPCFNIDVGSFSSKWLIMAVRKSVCKLCDLPRNTPASPNNVSGMIDVSAKNLDIFIFFVGELHCELCHMLFPSSHYVSGIL